MATSNPRLTITLTPTTAARLRRMSELTGNSQSAMISELLDGSGQVFDRLIVLLEAAHTAREAVTDETVAGLDRAQAKIEEQLGLVLHNMDEGSRPLLEQAESIRRRARRAPSSAAGGAPLAGIPPAREGARRGVPTPISNRGVRSDHGKGKNPTSMRVSGHLAGEKSGTEKRAKKGARNGAV